MRLVTVLPILLLWTSLSFQAVSFGKEYFVDNVAGDDTRDGSQPQSATGRTGPFRTISRALRAAQKGDRIVIADTGEPYRESLTFQAGRHSGWPRIPFEVEGNGAILDGTVPVPVEAWQHVEGDLFRFRPLRMAHSLLFLDTLPVPRIAMTEDGQLPELEPLQCFRHDRHLYFRTEVGRSPADYPLRFTALPVGIGLYEVRNLTIRNLIVHGFAVDGVNAHDGAFDVRLQQIVARGNGRSGISIGGASRVSLEGCEVGGNGRVQLRTEGYSHTRLVGTALLNDDPAAPAQDKRGGEIVTVE